MRGRVHRQKKSSIKMISGSILGMKIPAFMRGKAAEEIEGTSKR
jgi:hypothetical protein